MAVAARAVAGVATSAPNFCRNSDMVAACRSAASAVHTPSCFTKYAGLVSVRNCPSLMLAAEDRSMAAPWEHGSWPRATWASVKT